MARLLAAEADVNATDRRGVTALLLCAQLGRADIAQLLLENGADTETRAPYVPPPLPPFPSSVLTLA